MYIEKTCSVNLNYSMEICSNLTSGNYSEIQAEVHKHVSTLQSINGILQVCLSNFRVGEVTTGLGFITSHGLREYEVEKLRSLPAVGWRTQFFHLIFTQPMGNDKSLPCMCVLYMAGARPRTEDRVRPSSDPPLHSD